MCVWVEGWDVVWTYEVLGWVGLSSFVVVVVYVGCIPEVFASEGCVWCGCAFGLCFGRGLRVIRRLVYMGLFRRGGASGGVCVDQSCLSFLFGRCCEGWVGGLVSGVRGVGVGVRS